MFWFDSSYSGGVFFKTMCFWHISSQSYVSSCCPMMQPAVCVALQVFVAPWNLTTKIRININHGICHVCFDLFFIKQQEEGLIQSLTVSLNGNRLSSGSKVRGRSSLLHATIRYFTNRQTRRCIYMITWIDDSLIKDKVTEKINISNWDVIRVKMTRLKSFLFSVSFLKCDDETQRVLFPRSSDTSRFSGISDESGES